MILSRETIIALIIWVLTGIKIQFIHTVLAGKADNSFGRCATGKSVFKTLPENLILC